MIINKNTNITKHSEINYIIKKKHSGSDTRVGLFSDI